MQHAYGKPMHRSTIWRQGQRWAKEREENQTEATMKARQKRRGPRENSKSIDTLYFQFVAAVVGLVNKKGFCHYPEIWRDVKLHRGRPFWKAPASLVQKISFAGFPPAQMFVAICDLVPLNHVTRGGPDSSSNGSIREKAHAMVRDSISRRAWLDAKLKAKGYSRNERETYLTEAESSNYLAKWIKVIAPDATVTEGPLPRSGEVKGARPYFDDAGLAIETVGFHSHGDEPDAMGADELQLRPERKQRGTPAQRVEFCGVKMSRTMASYWRNHKSFFKCKNFLKGLFTRPIPARPYHAMSRVDKLTNEAFRLWMKKARKSRE